MFHGEDAILVADKTGDAHVFSVENDSGKLILGHLSMLLGPNSIETFLLEFWLEK